jgi:outer membrane protein OmpA-like peptidoglycan-associated protein
MMTLFLCFFIILVTMAPKPESGLMAAGLGEFVNVLEGSGVGGALDGNARLQKVNEFRQRFGLSPLTLEEYLANQPETKSAPDLERMVGDYLRDYSELRQPALIVFEPSSTELDETLRKQLDRAIKSLRPLGNEILVLEGWAGTDLRRGAERAAVVRTYLVDHHAFNPQKIEARGGSRSTDAREERDTSRQVDFRLVAPAPSATDG